jgi:hypothetical protein
MSEPVDRRRPSYTPRQKGDGTYGLGDDFGESVGEILRESLSERDMDRWRAALHLPPVRREEAAA